MQRAMHPERAPYIRRFPELFPGIPTLINHYEVHYRQHKEKKHSVLLAWHGWQNDGAGDEMIRFGALFFYERYMRAIEDAQQGIEMVIRDHANKFKDQIEPIDEIGSCNDPAQLFNMYGGERFGSDYRADETGRFEIARKLTIANQIMCVAAADPYERVTGDLSNINIMAGKCLFTAAKPQVMLGFVIDTRPGKNNRLHPDHELQLSLDTEAVFRWPHDVVGDQRVYGCRLIADGDRLYYVQTDSRPKPRISGVIKLERGGMLTDRRGLKHIVVAVQEKGLLRVATREDVAHVADIARARLWRSPLIEEEDTSGVNAYSNPEYWALKIIGRYDSVHEQVPVAARVEHQLTVVNTDLNADFATDDLGHKGYRQKVVRQFILPNWFPVTTYGIDWSTFSRT